MITELTAKDRGFLRAIGAADSVMPPPVDAADEIARRLQLLDELHRQELAAATARAAEWKRKAFICFSGNVLMSAGIVIFLLSWVATR